MPQNPAEFAEELEGALIMTKDIKDDKLVRDFYKRIIESIIEALLAVPLTHSKKCAIVEEVEDFLFHNDEEYDDSSLSGDK